jgi:hypothetical protein
MRELNDDVRQVLSAVEAGRDEVRVDDMTRQVRAGLSHQRRNSADQHRFGNPLRAVPRDIADDLAAVVRMSDMDRILEVERLGQSGKIVGEVSMSLPCQGWLDRPCPRRSLAMAR